MSTLGAWRDAIKTRLTSQVTQATVEVTTDIVSTIEANNWKSPTLFVELDYGRTGENRIIGGVEHEYGAVANIYVAVRGGETDSDSGILELAEEKTSTGAHDLIDSVITALLGYSLPGAGAPHLIADPNFWDQYATANMIVVYVVHFQITGGVLRSM